MLLILEGPASGVGNQAGDADLGEHAGANGVRALRWSVKSSIRFQLIIMRKTTVHMIRRY